MGHRLFTGSFAALEKRLFEQIDDLQKDDPLVPVSILIGSNLLGSYLRIRLAERGRVSSNLRFYTFLDLATRLAQPPGGTARKVRLPQLGASALLEHVLAEHQLPVFATVSAFAGFKDALLDTFRDLRDAGVDPAMLDEGARRCVKSDPDRRERLLGLTELYRRFRAKAELFHDIDNDFHAAAANAARFASAVLGSTVLLVYGIYDVTGQQSDLLSRLKDAVELRYFIPYINDAVSGFARSFVDARVRELGVAAEVLEHVPPALGLGLLLAGDFGLPVLRPNDSSAGKSDGTAATPDGSFALISAPGDSRGANEIVREILRAVQEAVIAGFHEAAVILRHPEEQAPVVTESLRLRNIPYFLDGGCSFLERPLGRAILALAGLEASGFTRRAILRAMELVAASLPDAGAGKWEVQEWRALTNDPRFLSGEDAWDGATKVLVREASLDLRNAATVQEDEAECKTVSAARAGARLESARCLEAAWKSLRSAAAGWAGFRSWQEWAQLLKARLEPLLGACEDWSRFSAVLDGLSSLSEAAVHAGISPVVPQARLVSALTESFSDLRIPEGRFLKTGVNLFSPGAARGLRFPLVIVPGLEEGSFPARLRQDPLLLDDERSRIASGRLPLKAQRGEEEKLLFDMAARSAERRLVLMTSRLDEGSDRERIPSEFFLRAASSARGEAVNLRDLREGVIPGFRSVSLDNPAPAGDLIPIDEAEIRLRLLTARSVPSRAILSVLSREEPGLLRGPAAYDDARWQRALTQFDGNLSSPDLIRAVAARIGPAAGDVSASRLEEYAKCPYLFYLKRIIGLERWEEEEVPERMNPLDRGRAIHAILERFLGEYSGDKFAGAPMDVMRRSLGALARAMLEEVRPAGMPDLLWEIERDALESVLRTWLEFERERAEGGLLPASVERTFGKFPAADGAEALRLQAGRHIFVFRGRIDRIDLSRDSLRARLIDYKTGILPKSMSGGSRPLLMGGEKIQIALYRGALALLEGFTQVEGVVGEYLHLQPKDGRVVSCSFSDTALEQAYDRLPEVLEIIGDGLDHGSFFARTSGAVYPDGHCAYCDFLPVCGKDRAQREERKAGDPAVLRFGRIREIDVAAAEVE